MGVSYSSSVQPVVAIEKTVFYRERAAGMYSAIPYAISQVHLKVFELFLITQFYLLFFSSFVFLITLKYQVTIELPYVLVQSLMYSVIVYSMIGFEWTAAKFLWYALFSYMTLLYYTFYGMMAVGLTPNFSIGAIVSSAFYGLWSLFSGFVMPRTVTDCFYSCVISDSCQDVDDLKQTATSCRGCPCTGDGITG